MADTTSQQIFPNNLISILLLAKGGRVFLEGVYHCSHALVNDTTALNDSRHKGGGALKALLPRLWRVDPVHVSTNGRGPSYICGDLVA